MIYTNGDFLNRYFTDIRAFDLWYAAWPANPDPAHPPRTCGIWQYGGSKIDGIGGSVDTNAAYRDYPTIIRNAGLNHLKPLPTEDELAEAWAERTVAHVRAPHENHAISQKDGNTRNGLWNQDNKGVERNVHLR